MNALSEQLAALRLHGIAFSLLAPGTQAVRRAAKPGRNRTICRCIAGIIAAVLSKQPDTALAKFGWIGGGESSLCHRAHPLSVLLSGKPGAVHDILFLFEVTPGNTVNMAQFPAEFTLFNKPKPDTFVKSVGTQV